MNCNHCTGALIKPHEFVRGKCDPCDKKDRTYTECNRMVEPAFVRDHKECLDTSIAYQRLNNRKIEVKHGRVCV